MDNVLEMRVRRAYPDFFAMMQGSMVWTPTIAAGDGWYPILISLLVALRELAAYSGATFTDVQLKEKFGHLRVYFSTHNTKDADVTELADLFIQTAEFYSKSTCEICGNEGSLVTANHWYRVRCSSHTNVTERSASDWSGVFCLIEAPQPTLDFSLLSPRGRIEKLSEEGPNNLRLSLVTYRSMENYIGARINDVEIVQEIGLFDSAPEAMAVAKHYGCSVFYIQPCEKTN